MEQPPKSAALKTVADIVLAYEDGSLATRPLAVLTNAVILLEDVRFDMIQNKQDSFQLTEANNSITLGELRQLGDYMNERRNSLLQADAVKYATVDEFETEITADTGRMSVSIDTNGANLQPEMAKLIDLFTNVHTVGHLKATYQTRDALDSPIWTLELTAPQLTLRPLFATRSVIVNAMTARRSGANCVATVTLTLMQP